MSVESRAVSGPQTAAAEKPAASAAAPRTGRAGAAYRGLGLVLALAALVLIGLLSVWVGTRGIPFTATWHALWNPDGSETSVIIHDYRIPRTLLGILVGAALGLAGALMQALTRNPLADPGMLGVNLGASAGVVVAIAFFGVAAPLGYVWFALAGAAAASTGVYVLGSSGRKIASPNGSSSPGPP